MPMLMLIPRMEQACPSADVLTDPDLRVQRHEQLAVQMQLPRRRCQPPRAWLVEGLIEHPIELS
jgi:hypothetical protein